MKIKKKNHLTFCDIQNLYVVDDTDFNATLELCCLGEAQMPIFFQLTNSYVLSTVWYA